jgi:hypothetical protein
LSGLRQVWLALGEDRGRIRRLWLVQADTPPADAAAITATDPGVTVALAGSDAADFVREFRPPGGQPDTPAGGIYVVDPLGNLVLYYPADGRMSAVLKDLQRLLKVSRIG